MNEEFLARLGILANILQVANYSENVKQTSNDEIMKMLEHQNATFLEIIIKQNELIIELLGGNNDVLRQSQRNEL